MARSLSGSLSTTYDESRVFVWLPILRHVQESDEVAILLFRALSRSRNTFSPQAVSLQFERKMLPDHRRFQI